MFLLMPLQVVLARRRLCTAFYGTVIHSRSVVDTIDMSIEIFRGSPTYATMWTLCWLVVISHVAAR